MQVLTLSIQRQRYSRKMRERERERETKNESKIERVRERGKGQNFKGHLIAGDENVWEGLHGKRVGGVGRVAAQRVGAGRSHVTPSEHHILIQSAIQCDGPGLT